MTDGSHAPAWYMTGTSPPVAARAAGLPLTSHSAARTAKVRRGIQTPVCILRYYAIVSVICMGPRNVRQSSATSGNSNSALKTTSSRGREFRRLREEWLLCGVSQPSGCRFCLHFWRFLRRRRPHRRTRRFGAVRSPYRGAATSISALRFQGAARKRHDIAGRR
jgi:hypothetical protein